MIAAGERWLLTIVLPSESSEWSEELFHMIKENIFDAGRVVINDINLDHHAIRYLEGLGTTVVDPQRMSDSITALLAGTYLGVPALTLVVGRSGALMANYFDPGVFGSVIHVHASTLERFGSIPLVTTSALEWPRFMDPRIRVVTVFDDVISTGTTLELLAKRNAWKFPNARWQAAVWLTRKRKLDGYACIYGAVYISNREGKRVPINSLSTFRSDPAMAFHYAEKHFGRNAAQFLQVIKVQPEIALA